VVSEDDYNPHGMAITSSFQDPINAGDAHVDAKRFAGHERVYLGFLNVQNADYLDYMHGSEASGADYQVHCRFPAVSVLERILHELF
jgi:hypothetical protein